MVAIALALCALLIVATAGLISLPLPTTLPTWLTQALTVVLLLRAIEDLQLVGFFKRSRDIRCTPMDTMVYFLLYLLLEIDSSLVGRTS